MVKDYIDTHNFHLFMLFFAFIFVRWGVVFFRAIRYKPYRFPKEKLNFFTSVVIPIVDESPELFRVSGLPRS